MFAEYAAEHIHTPTFALQSMYAPRLLPDLESTSPEGLQSPRGRSPQKDGALRC